jgi:hypothetical protein
MGYAATPCTTLKSKGKKNELKGVFTKKTTY